MDIKRWQTITINKKTNWKSLGNSDLAIDETIREIDQNNEGFNTKLVKNGTNDNAHSYILIKELWSWFRAQQNTSCKLHGQPCMQLAPDKQDTRNMMTICKTRNMLIRNQSVYGYNKLFLHCGFALNYRADKWHRDSDFLNCWVCISLWSARLLDLDGSAT